MTLTVRQCLEIISHEGAVRETYLDSVGVPTWGIGVTSKSGHNVERYWGNPQPIERVLEIFIWLLETKYLPAVRKAFEGCELNEAQLAAALSFHYNTGAIDWASWVKSFRDGNVSAAKRNIMLWRKPAEIIPRREKERDLFFEGKWSNDGKMTIYPVKNKRPDWSGAYRLPIREALVGLLAPELPAALAQPVQQLEIEMAAQPTPSSDTFQQLFRIVAQFGAGILATHGYLDGSMTETFIGAVVSLAGIAWWAFWNKQRTTE